MQAALQCPTLDRALQLGPWEKCALIYRPSPLVRGRKSEKDVRWLKLRYLSWTVPIPPTLCVLRGPCCLICAPLVSHKGGGGEGTGYIQKALEKGYLGHPGSACCTDGMLEIFVCFARCLCCLLPVFVNRQLPCPHTSSLHCTTKALGVQKSVLWECQVGAGA